MTTELIAGILGVVASTLAIGDYFLRNGWPWAKNGRLPTGVWVGRVTQQDHPLGLNEMTVRMILKNGRTGIAGTGVLKSVDGRIAVTVLFRGRFRIDEYLKLDYHNADPTALQFGTLFLRLDGTGRKLEGRFVGYGNYAERIVHGTCELDKEI